MVNFNKMTDGKIAGIILPIAVSILGIGFYFLRLRRLFLAFIIGSSLPATIFSLSYIGLSNLKFKGIKNFEYMAVYVPLYYGVFNVLNVAFSRRFRKLKYLSMIIPFIVGGLHGLIFSVYGRYLMGNLPVKNLQFKENDGLVHIYAFIYYAAVYSIVISLVNKMYLLY